jgi:hypothetical protein
MASSTEQFNTFKILLKKITNCEVKRYIKTI